MGRHKADSSTRAEVLQRRQAGEPQGALAEEFGVSRQTIARWCRVAAEEGAVSAAAVTGAAPRIMPTAAELLVKAPEPQLPDMASTSQALTAASLARWGIGNLTNVGRRHGDPDAYEDYDPKLSAWCADRVLYHLSRSGVLEALQGPDTQLRVSLLSEAELYGWTLLSEALDELARMAGARTARPVRLPDAERERWEELVRCIQRDVLGVA